MRSEHQKKVDEFHRLAGHIDPTEPTVPSLETRRLRAKLILEEALETILGLGFSLVAHDSNGYANKDFELLEIQPPNLEEIADGCWDLRVVTTGTLSACGIDDTEGQEEVDNNNLAKFGPGGYRRDDGKWIKPKNHPKPRIKEILDEQRAKVDNIK